MQKKRQIKILYLDRRFCIMFEKIKSIFQRIFGTQKMLIEGSEKAVPKQNNFKKELNKNIEILNIQKMYEDGKITEDDLRISQIKELIKLYKEQTN
jgi:hypothetical protein